MPNDEMLEVFALSGSQRSGSYNTALIDTAIDLAGDGLKIMPFSLRTIPMYDADLEKAGMPEPVHRMREAIRNADAVLLATPEYNGSTTPLLKNAIDWASRGGADSPLRGKIVAIFGAGGRFGTLRAQLHLREILTSTGMNVLARPTVYVDRPGEKVAGGRYVDERVRSQIAQLLDGLTTALRDT